MTDTSACFVQFPHPGKEHNSPSDEMPWNTEKHHRRKFLVAPGRYLDGDQQSRTAELVFWGEWEPPSRVERRWSKFGSMPQALHSPYWAEPRGTGFRQNTDPWVFGNRMIYGVCKQTGPRPKRRPTSMQRLGRGSVICFGSVIGGGFCVDTVFVVASAEPWIPTDLDALDVSDAWKTCTGQSVATREGDAHRSLTLYRGAAADEPVEGMFSFVPARRADLDDPRFPRPFVESSFINPASQQSPRGSKCELPMQILRSTWAELRDQVLAADLLLATRIQTPDREEVGLDPTPALTPH